MVNIKDMVKLAEVIGNQKTGVSGKCIAKKYINDKTPIEWQCGKCGNIWKAQPNHVKRGSWCPNCAGNVKRTIIDMKKLAERVGILMTGKPGICLSTEYINNRTPLKWQCGKCGTTWKSAPRNIRRNYWCKKCAGIKRYTIQDMHEIARKRGLEETNMPGKCLSNNYENNKAILKWQCGKCSYIWNSNAKNVISETWCPNCSKSKMERKTREFFEEIFQVKFPTTSPEWLINPLTGKKMHLDGYNKNLQLAFEYNGPQHYQFHKFFHKSYQEYLDQRKRDYYKKELCMNNMIILITIPYTIKPSNLKDYIKNQYKQCT